MLEKKSIFCALLLISMMFVGCDPEPNSGDLGPRIKLYKTRADYSNNLAALVTDDGSVFYVNGTFIDIDNDNDTIFNASRIKLADGYILDREGLHDFYNYHVVFLKLTFEEGYRIHRLQWYVEDHLDSLILDSDPYVELYEDNTPDRMFGTYYCYWKLDSTLQQVDTYLYRDTAFLNGIIRNGEIEKYFKRLK